MNKKFDELPGWTFFGEEISANVYKVGGKADAGPSVEFTGTDPDALLDECKRYAAKINADSNQKGES